MKYISTIFTLVLLITLTSTSTAQTDWTKYLDNPVLDPGPTGAWDDGFMGAPTVLYDGNTYHMWYWGESSSTTRYIGYATSPDGISWIKYDDPTTTSPLFAESDPVLDRGQAGAWDNGSVATPSVLFLDDTYHIWYAGGNDPTLSGPISIGHATSNDGINWEKDTLNPVLTPGTAGTWDDDWLFAPCILFDGSNYHMWYSAWNGIGDQVRIGHATSPHPDSTWTKDTNNPVLSYEVGSWDYPRTDGPNVVYDGTTFHMWYYGGEWFEWRVGYATSPNGSDWTKYAGNPVLDWGTAGNWDDTWVGACSVILEDSTFKMWYTGGNGVWDGHIGYAVDFSNIAHSDSIGLHASYLNPGVDTLWIDARIVNPDESTLIAKAQIVSEDTMIVDSTDLTDKGDGIWSGKWPVPAGERNYRVGIKTIDEASGMIHNGLLWNIENFTTIGPVAFDDYTITSDEDTIPNPGDRLVFEISLKNNGIASTATDISIKATNLDTCTRVVHFTDPKYGDIAPGEVAEPSRGITVIFSENCPDNILTLIKVDIYSGIYNFWSDTFSIEIIPTDIADKKSSLPKKFALGQNYPNPFNPKTIINYELPITNDVNLSIYNLLGQRVAMLVNKRQKAGYHEVEWDATGFASGIYYYRIEAGEFQDVKKMILLR